MVWWKNYNNYNNCYKIEQQKNNKLMPFERYSEDEYLKESEITTKEAQKFYRSKEWKETRKTFLSNYSEFVCVGCGLILEDNSSLETYLNVDHIKPLKYF